MSAFSLFVRAVFGCALGLVLGAVTAALLTLIFGFQIASVSLGTGAGLLAILAPFLAFISALLANLAVAGLTVSFLAFVALLLWLLVVTAITAVPYAVASLNVFGPQGERIGRIPGSALAESARAFMVGMNAGMNAIMIAPFAAAAAALASGAVAPVNPVFAGILASLLGALVALGWLLVLAVHAGGLFPLLSRRWWVRCVVGWGGLLMPMSLLATLSVGLFYALTNLAGLAGGRTFRFEPSWRTGALVFVGGLAEDLIAGGAAGFAAGNCVFIHSSVRAEPPPLGGSTESLGYVRLHEVGHVLNTACLGSAFLVLDAIVENVLGRGGYDYGEMLAESNARTPTAYAGRPFSSIDAFAWFPLWSDEENALPVAAAGNDRHFATPEPVNLSAASSVDADGFPGLPLGYRWSVADAPRGSTTASVFPEAGPVTVFFPDVPGRYRVGLDVHDGVVSGYPDFVCIMAGGPRVSVDSPDGSPVEPDQLVGTRVSLRANPAGSPAAAIAAATFLWDLVDVPPGSDALLELDPAGPPTWERVRCFLDLPGRYVVRLTMRVPGMGDPVDSCPVSLTLTARCDASPPVPLPVARLTAPAEAVVGAVVAFDGSGSAGVADGTITYEWKLLEAPPGNRAALVPDSTAAADPALQELTPVLPGRYVVSLVAIESNRASCRKAFAVQVHCDSTGRPSAAIAATFALVSGAIRSLDDGDRVRPGTVVRLDAVSAGAPGATVDHEWTLDDSPPGSAALIVDPTRANTRFLADLAGVYVVRLVVSADGVASCPVTLTVLAQDLSTGLLATGRIGGLDETSPIFGPGADFDLIVGSKVFLVGTESTRPGGLPRTLQWSFHERPPGSEATLLAPDPRGSEYASFVADRTGRYTVALVVRNEAGPSARRMFTYRIWNP